MAYTEAQWNKLQQSLPTEDRTSYIDYIQEADPATYNRLIGATLARLKADSAEPKATATPIVDERTKAAGAKTDTAAQKTAQKKAASTVSSFRAKEAEDAKNDAAATPSISAAEGAAGARALERKLKAEDDYYTKKVGDTGKTQAQLDALATANRVALITGGTVDENGKIIPPKVPRTPEELAAGLEAAEAKDAEIDATKSEIKTPTQIAAENAANEILGGDDEPETKGELGPKPGAAWILSADGKSWVKPPTPTEKGKSFSWDDEKGWVGFTVGSEEETEEVDTDGTGERPIGTPPAFVWDPISKTWKMPLKPTGKGNWVWDNVNGWVDTLVNPGSTGFATGSERTLAQDTFKNTLALFFGAKEVSQPWVSALFNVVSGYYKTGSTIDEALNLSLQDVRNKPELAPFTKRFAGVYALQDRLAAGEAIDVPTIAEFFKSESILGDKLREVGLGDIATQEILGDVLGTGKSVAAVLSLVDNVFMTIDNAPEQLKKDLQVVAPGVDRTSIAKALLLGKKGAEELQKKIKEVSVFSAAKSQGVGIGNAIAADYAARGFDYNQSLEGFGTVAKGSPTLQKLTEISTQTKSTSEDAQKTLMKSIFEKDVKAQEQLRMEAEKEVSRFSGSSGTMGSRSLASRNRANRTI